MDILKEVEIRAYAYYVIKNLAKTSLNTVIPSPPKQKSIQPILFLNKKLTSPEIKY